MVFPAPEERYDTSRGLVVFWGQDRTQRIRCAISREALDDHFHGDKKNKLDVFRENRPAIEDIARRKYLSGRRTGRNHPNTHGRYSSLRSAALLVVMMIMMTTLSK